MNRKFAVLCAGAFLFALSTIAFKSLADDTAGTNAEKPATDTKAELLGPATAIRPAPLMPSSRDVASIPEKKAGTIRIAMAGDSTMTNEAGWGVGFNQLLGDNIECINMSRGGRSSGSFVDEGRWKELLSLKPDYVLVQFGHNDQPGHPVRSSDPETTYRENMTRYITEARAAGVTPVLITPLSRRQWGSDERIHSTLWPYAVTVRKIAAEMKVPLVELHEKSIDFYEKLGKTAMEDLSPLKPATPAANAKSNSAKGSSSSQAIASDSSQNATAASQTASATDAAPAPGMVFDGTHLNAKGSVAIGEIVADELRKVVPDLAPSIRTQRRFMIVAPDASGDFKTIHQAIAAIPDHSALRTFVHIKPGIYEEGQILLPKVKSNVTFEGEDAVHTVLRYRFNVREPEPSVAQGFTGTGVVVLADDFHANKIQFENASGNHGQALALRIEADRAILRNCRMTGWQDTLLINNGRVYFDKCVISGRVDFIYGSATAVFDKCEIVSRNRGHITAASTPQDHPFGFVFLNCKLTYEVEPWINLADPNDSNSSKPDKADLGRPWKDYACVAFLNCDLGDHINPTGFTTWKGFEQREKTARYYEYKSTGPGASPKTRLNWVHQLTDEEAKAYTIPNILGGADKWDPTARELPVNAKTL